MGSKYKVYLSGAMTSIPNYLDDFDRWERILAMRGYHVFNPAHQQARGSHSEYLKYDIGELVKCDMIFFVNDVSSSKGAFVEKLVADACGIKELKSEDI